MLKSIECERLTQTSLLFKEGLNTLIGADDAHNSIGKSSVLMLIDFAFAGDDFPEKCDDVIKNIGHFDVKITFEFDKIYSFIRNTNKPDNVLCLEKNEIWQLEKYRNFLQVMYGLDKLELSFRECVSAFFRIYQRNNYNEKEPLHIVPKESWSLIKKRLLKFFDEYKKIELLESNKKTKEKNRMDINGTFNSGSVKKITKKQFEKNKITIEDLNSKISNLKETLSLNITDIYKILNDDNYNLMVEKEKLLKLLQKTKVSLHRIESNMLKKGKDTSALAAIMELIPSINIDKLNNIDKFHNGIATILNEQLKIDKAKLSEDLDFINSQIDSIDSKLKKNIELDNKNSVLLDILLELDQEQQTLKIQNKYFELSDNLKKEIDYINTNINTILVESISRIQIIINKSLAIFIKKIYPNNPIEPKLLINNKKYIFDCGDDRGTGKGFSNLISLDLAFLDNTLLPCLIHDSLLFKNLGISAVENLIGTYCSFEKQIFISIDEVKKYKKEMQQIVYNSMFLKLDKDNIAFKVDWKKKT